MERIATWCGKKSVECSSQDSHSHLILSVCDWPTEVTPAPQVMAPLGRHKAAVRGPNTIILSVSASPHLLFSFPPPSLSHPFHTPSALWQAGTADDKIRHLAHKFITRAGQHQADLRACVCVRAHPLTGPILAASCARRSLTLLARCRYLPNPSSLPLPAVWASWYVCVCACVCFHSWLAFILINQQSVRIWKRLVWELNPPLAVISPV